MKNTVSSQSLVGQKSGLEILTKYRGAIMGIAALWILFFHEWQLLSTEVGKAAEFENYIKRIGFCGVDIFLFLSGIGLVFAIGKRNIFSFYYRRLKRVYLPFLIVGIIRAVTEKWTSEGFWDNVLCISFYKTNMYSFLWFVPAILTLYLLFPPYYKLFSKASNKLMFTAAMFLIWMTLSLLFRDKLRPDLYGFTNRIPVFLFGVYAGHLTKTHKEPFTKTVWFSLTAVLVSGLYFAYLANFKGIGFIVPTSNCFLPNLLIAVSFPFITAKLLDLLCSIPKAGIIGKGIVKFFSFFGLFSLELYCVQEWLSGKLLAEIADQTPMMKNIAVFALCTIAGFVLYLVVKYFWILVEFIAKLVKSLIKSEKTANK
ncbi:MAG: acyltransferase [Ruminococcus sp.]|nr:acyltransferase [Ruminococcus sp.]